MSALNHQIIIVGGGAAGITVAAQLLKKQSNLDIAIIEPSDKHYYQPACCFKREREKDESLFTQ